MAMIAMMVMHDDAVTAIQPMTPCNREGTASWMQALCLARGERC